MLVPGALSNWPKISFTWPRLEQKALYLPNKDFIG